jgi:hypothetical protein
MVGLAGPSLIQMPTRCKSRNYKLISAFVIMRITVLSTCDSNAALRTLISTKLGTGNGRHFSVTFLPLNSWIGSRLI